MKKIMILGASYSVVPLIQAAKKLGLYTIAASIPGDYPGFDEADVRCYVDITNPDAVVAQAKALGIDAVATCCMDVGLRAQGHVCSALRLPGPSRETVDLCTNKHRMKQAFLKAGVNTARFFRISSEADLAPAMAQLRFPLIVKAVDQMGSRGIFRCNTPEEVYENYPKSMAASRQDYCLLEEFIEGQLFGVEAMVQDGVPVFVLPDGTTAFQAATPTPVGHYVPAPELEPVHDQITHQVERIVAAFGLGSAPVNCDMIVRDGEVFVVEATARAGATCLPELVGTYYGVNYYEQIVRLAAGLPLNPKLGGDGEHTPALSHILLSTVSGTLVRLENTNPPAEDLLDLSLNVSPGEEVHAYSNGRDRLGQIILKAPTPELCQKRLAQVLDGLHIEITS